MRVISPFPRLSYADAMEFYGSDKPDPVRFGLKLADHLGHAARRRPNSRCSKRRWPTGGLVKGLQRPGL